MHNHRGKRHQNSTADDLQETTRKLAETTAATFVRHAEKRQQIKTIDSKVGILIEGVQKKRFSGFQVNKKHSAIMSTTTPAQVQTNSRYNVAEAVANKLSQQKRNINTLEHRSPTEPYTHTVAKCSSFAA